MINKSVDFLFYMRNVYGNQMMTILWKDLFYYFTDDSSLPYVDIVDFNDQDIQFLARITKNAPSVINNLRGYKLSEQLKIIKKLFNYYKDDPIIAISILEKNKIDPDLKIDDHTSLLLELSVRKEILNDNTNKVIQIMNPESVNTISDFFDF